MSARLSRAEAAEILGITPNTLSRWRTEGRVPANATRAQLKRLAAQPEPAAAKPVRREPTMQEVRDEIAEEIARVELVFHGRRAA